MAIIDASDPDELGGVTFRRDDGSTLYSFGPEAQALSAELGRMPQPQLVAGGPGAPGGGQLIDLDAGGVEGPLLRPRPGRSLDAAPSEYRQLAPQPYGYGADPDVAQGMSLAPTPYVSPGTVSLDDVPITGDATPRAGQLQLQEQQVEAEPGAPLPVAGQAAAPQTKRGPAGKWQPSTRSVVSEGAIPVSPEIEQAYAALAQQEQAIREARYTQDTQRIDAATQRYAAQSQEVRRRLDLAEAERLRIKRVAEREVERLRQMDAEMKAADKIDPKRLFKNNSTIANIGVMLGAALSAYGAALSGQKNQVLDMINASIDRDIDAQKADYLRSRDARANLVGQLNLVYGDVEQATQAARYLAHEYTASQAREIEQAAKRDDVTRAYQDWTTSHQQAQMKRLEDVYRASIGKQTITEAEKFVPPQAAGSGDSLAAKTKKIKQEADFLAQQNRLAFERAGGETGPKLQKAERETRERYVEGYGEAASADEAKAVRNILKERDANNAAIDDLVKEAQTASTLVPGSAARARAKAKKAGVERRLAKSFGGTITEGDRVAAGMELPDPTSYMPNRASVAAAVAGAAKEANNRDAEKAIANIVGRRSVQGAPKKEEE